MGEDRDVFDVLYGNWQALHSWWFSRQFSSLLRVREDSAIRVHSLGQVPTVPGVSTQIDADKEFTVHHSEIFRNLIVWVNGDNLIIKELYHIISDAEFI